MVDLKVARSCHFRQRVQYLTNNRRIDRDIKITASISAVWAGKADKDLKGMIAGLNIILCITE